MSVSIIPEFSDDLVRFECVEDRIARYALDGSPEYRHKIELRYDAIDKLERVPADFKPVAGKGAGARVWMEEIYIPKCDRTVYFICSSVPENSWGEREGKMRGGPYLIK